MNWGDPGVQAAMVQSIGAVAAAIIAGIVAGIIGHKIADRKRLRENLMMALSDIQFLLEVEKAYCEQNLKNSGESGQRRVRRAVQSNGFTWSGKFTPGRVRSQYPSIEHH